jgi:hypothetical protein
VAHAKVIALTVLTTTAVIGAAAFGAWAWWRSTQEPPAQASPTQGPKGVAGQVRKQSPEHQVLTMVRERLVDPDSAQFQDVYQVASTPTVWCGMVNARNRMGGFSGKAGFVVLLDPQNPSSSDLASVYVDDAASARPDFRLKWNVYCLAP